MEGTSLGYGLLPGSIDLNLSILFPTFTQDQGIDSEAQDDLPSPPHSPMMVETELLKDMPSPDPLSFEVSLRSEKTNVEGAATTADSSNSQQASGNILRTPTTATQSSSDYLEIPVEQRKPWRQETISGGKGAEARPETLSGPNDSPKKDEGSMELIRELTAKVAALKARVGDLESEVTTLRELVQLQKAKLLSLQPQPAPQSPPNPATQEPRVAASLSLSSSSTSVGNATKKGEDVTIEAGTGGGANDGAAPTTAGAEDLTYFSPLTSLDRELGDFFSTYFSSSSASSSSSTSNADEATAAAGAADVEVSPVHTEFDYSLVSTSTTSTFIIHPDLESSFIVPYQTSRTASLTPKQTLQRCEAPINEVVAWGFDGGSQRIWLGRYYGLPVELDLLTLSLSDYCRIVTLGLINPTKNMLAWQTVGWVRIDMMRILRKLVREFAERAIREELEDRYLSVWIEAHAIPPTYEKLVIKKFLQLSTELVQMQLLEVSPLLDQGIIVIALEEAIATGKLVVDNNMAHVLYIEPIVLDDTTSGEQVLPNQAMADSPVGQLDVDAEVGVGPSMEAEAEGPAVLEAQFVAGTAEAVASKAQVATPVAPAVIDASLVSGPIPVVEKAALTPSSPPLLIQDKGKRKLTAEELEEERKSKKRARDDKYKPKGSVLLLKPKAKHEKLPAILDPELASERLQFLAKLEAMGYDMMEMLGWSHEFAHSTLIRATRDQLDQQAKVKKQEKQAKAEEAAKLLYKLHKDAWDKQEAMRILSVYRYSSQRTGPMKHSTRAGLIQEIKKKITTGELPPWDVQYANFQAKAKESIKSKDAALKLKKQTSQIKASIPTPKIQASKPSIPKVQTPKVQKIKEPPNPTGSSSDDDKPIFTIIKRVHKPVTSTTSKDPEPKPSTSVSIDEEILKGLTRVTMCKFDRTS